MLFQYFSLDIKLEIFKQVADANTYGIMSSVCKEWKDLLLENIIWKALFLRDFGSWTWVEQDRDTDSSDNPESATRVTKTRKTTVSWLSKYKKYYLKGWQWDSRVKHPNIHLTDSNFTAYLSSGSNYHGLRASKELPMGPSYFEVQIEIPPNSEEEIRFDKSDQTYLSIGVANSTFDVERCITGWTSINDGAGYYNMGSCYVLSKNYHCHKYKVRCGDFLAFSCERDANNTKVIFYINREKVTEEITIQHKVPTKMFPHLILANSINCKVTITSRFPNFPRLNLTEKQLSYKNLFYAKQSYKNKKYKETILFLEQPLLYNPNWKTCWKWKGKAHQRIEEYKISEQCLTKAITINNQNSNSYLTRGFLYELMGRNDKTYYNLALSDYSIAIQLDPRYATAYNNRGVVWECLGNPENALADYQRSIEIKPNGAVTYKNRADLYETLNQFDLALNDYCKALEKDPKYPAAYNNRGYLYKRMGLYPKALSDYCKAIELDGLDSDHFLNRAYIYEMYEMFDEALNDYAKSIELNPKNEVAYNNRSNLWNTLGKYDKCIEDCKIAIELAPKDTNAFCHRAFAYMKSSDFENARKDLEISIINNEKYARSYCYRALLELEINSNNFEKMIQDCDKCIELNKDDIPDVYYVRAKIYYMIGSKSKAVDDLTMCLSIKFRGRLFPVPEVKKLLELCLK